MTCIVGLVHQGKVYVGGDSAGTNSNWELSIRKDRKVFVNSGYAMGFTSSFRMGQLLAYSLVPPKPTGKDLLRFMATEFVDAVRKCLKSGGYAETVNGTESGGCFLVGVQGRLFGIHEDFQVAENISGIDAVGCGSELAMGAMLATPKAKPFQRIRLALSIAERCSAGVRKPFHVVSVGDSC